MKNEYGPEAWTDSWCFDDLRNGAPYCFAAYDERFDASGFDCGHEAYNTWLTSHAATAARSGTAGVYVLVRQDDAGPRVLAYFAIAPTAVIRADLPRSASGGSPDPVLDFLPTKVDPLRLYMKVSSARAAVEKHDLSAD